MKDDLWKCKCTILLKFCVYKEIRQERFLFYAPISSEYLPNPTRGHSPRLRRRAEVRGEEVTPVPGAVSQVSSERTRCTRSGLCGMSSCEETPFFLPAWSELMQLTVSALFTLFTWPRKVVKCCPWSTGTIQKSRTLHCWILHKYYFCFLNIHGMHLVLWPWVKLLL